MSEPSAYVSRGGLKLAAALRAFGIEVRGLTCADFGSHAGGFVDCLLQHGAARVHAVDTAYGTLDYRLRTDARVTVHERTNALYVSLPELCTLITIDVGWTAQRLILPAARRNLQPGGSVLTLVKPHYEAPREELRGGLLPEECVAPVAAAVRADCAAAGWTVLGEVTSPIRGHGGNTEFVWWLRSM